VTRLARLRWSTALLSVLAAVWLYPVAWTLSNAIKSSADIYRAPWDLPWPPAIGNIGEAWSRGQLGVALANSTFVTAMTVAGVLVLAVSGAYSLTRLRPPRRAALLILVLAPLIIPTEVLIVPLFVELKTFGLLNTYLGALLPTFASAFGIFLLRQTFKTVPRELDEAARVEGASPLQVLLKVYVPLAKPVYIAYGLVSVSYHWNNFLWPLIVTNSVNTRPLTVGLQIFASSDQGIDWSVISAATLMTSAPLLIAFLLFQRQFVQSFMRAGIR